MKNIILIILILLISISSKAQLKVIKTASVSSVSPGEIFNYKITISGLTNLSQLKNFEDNLGTHLTYISDDFQSSSLYSLINSSCSGIANLTNSSGYTNIVRYNFNGCSGSILGSGSFSFNIKVQVNASACNENKISNTFFLNKGLTSQIISRPSLGDIPGPTYTNLVNTQWVLNKTFRSIDPVTGEMIFDVRLTSPNRSFGFSVLQNGIFSDTFTFPSCVTINGSNGKVYYIPDESNLANTTLLTSSGTIDGNTLQLNWGLPSEVKSSYLFQVKISPDNCTCSSIISFKNKAYFNALDLCSNPINLEDSSILNICNCSNGLISCQENIINSDISKIAILTNNSSNLTMRGCTGTYKITIKNNNASLNYTSIQINDILPVGITAGPATYSVSGCSMTGTISGSNFTSTSGFLAPGCALIMNIPFTVTSNIPNFQIQNCANVAITSINGSNPPVMTTNTACASIYTVPNEVAITTSKSICSPQSHTCLGLANNGNLPGDTVKYEMTFYNYGTISASNVAFSDILPNHFDFIDVKVYKKSNMSSNFTTCGTNGMSDITSTSSINYNSTIRELKVSLSNSNNLKEFTCSGMTVYKVVVRTKINNSAPNGNYDNAYKLKYKKDNNGQVDYSYSNTVRTLVNKNQMIFSNKTGQIDSTDCIGKTNTVKYRILVTNMSNIPITVNINDQIPVPSGVSAIGNVYGFSYYIGSSLTGPTNTTTLPSGTLSLLSHGFNINQVTIQPCQSFIVEFKVKYNTANLTSTQYVQACNKAIIEVGYMTSGIYNDYIDLTKSIANNPASNIITSSNSELISKWLDSASTNRIELLEQFTKESRRVDLKRYFTESKLQYSFNIPVFVPIVRDTVSTVECPLLHDCLKGGGSYCNGSPSSSYTFGIQWMDNTGKVSAKLNFSPGSKVRKIEFILSDIKKLQSGSFCMFCCPSNLTYSNPTITANNCYGYFRPSVFSSYAGFNYDYISLATFFSINGINYAEANKITYKSPSPLTLSGDYLIDFQLPITNLNCNGNYEFVITAIVYFDDCSICYVSVPYDYTAVRTWVIDTKPDKGKGLR